MVAKLVAVLVLVCACAAIPVKEDSAIQQGPGLQGIKDNSDLKTDPSLWWGGYGYGYPTYTTYRRYYYQSPTVYTYYTPRTYDSYYYNPYW